LAGFIVLVCGLAYYLFAEEKKSGKQPAPVRGAAMR